MEAAGAVVHAASQNRARRPLTAEAYATAVTVVWVVGTGSPPRVVLVVRIPAALSLHRVAV
jgi:hypothetical protein